ncbi:MAG: hypothetical protein IPM24_16540 [Bryobacterales bacterium]|nr:hypothetical protein [Bryobacterales bacterium]
MPTLLEKALEKVGALPQDEQDAIASQILETIADEEAWRRRFAAKRDVIRRMADEALAEDARGETVPLDEVQQDARRAYALFRANPGHPSLHFKKIEGFNDVE